jgi:hypothetical protein
MTKEQTEAMLRLGEVLYRLTSTDYSENEDALFADDDELRAALAAAAALSGNPASWMQDLSEFAGMQAPDESNPVDLGPAPRVVDVLMPTSLMHRTMARMQRTGMTGGLTAGIKAAVVAWTPEPPVVPMEDLVARFMAAAKAAPAHDRAAAVGRIIGAFTTRLDAMEAAGAPASTVDSARRSLRKWRGSPTSASFLLKAAHWVEACALSDASHRDPTTNPQAAGMREDFAWATPTKKR